MCVGGCVITTKAKNNIFLQVFLHSTDTFGTNSFEKFQNLLQYQNETPQNCTFLWILEYCGDLEKVFISFNLQRNEKNGA